MITLRKHRSEKVMSGSAGGAGSHPALSFWQGADPQITDNQPERSPHTSTTQSLLWAFFGFNAAMALVMVYLIYEFVTAPPLSFMISPLEPYEPIALASAIWIVGGALLGIILYVARNSATEQ